MIIDTNVINRKISDAFSSMTDKKYHIDITNNIYNILEDKIRLVIGEKRFSERVRKVYALGISSFHESNYSSGLPYVAISIELMDEEEKELIERIVVETIKEDLIEHNQMPQVIVDWKDGSFGMKIIMVRYSGKMEERKIINKVIALEMSSSDINAVHDKTEEDNLDE